MKTKIMKCVDCKKNFKAKEYKDGIWQKTCNECLETWL